MYTEYKTLITTIKENSNQLHEQNRSFQEKQKHLEEELLQGRENILNHLEEKKQEIENNIQNSRNEHKALVSKEEEEFSAKLQALQDKLQLGRKKIDDDLNTEIYKIERVLQNKKNAIRKIVISITVLAVVAGGYFAYQISAQQKAEEAAHQEKLRKEEAARQEKLRKEEEARIEKMAIDINSNPKKYDRDFYEQNTVGYINGNSTRDWMTGDKLASTQRQDGLYTVLRYQSNPIFLGVANVKNGKAEGYCAEYDRFDYKYTMVKDGKREGVQKVYDEDFNLIGKYTYKADKKDGPFEIYGKNGATETHGEYKDGRRITIDGTAIEHVANKEENTKDKAGNTIKTQYRIVADIHYKNGKEVSRLKRKRKTGQYIYNKNREKIQEIHYWSNGKVWYKKWFKPPETLESAEKRYYENGRLESETKYDRKKYAYHAVYSKSYYETGELEYQWDESTYTGTYYFKNGQIRKIYKNFERTSFPFERKTYHENGTLKTEYYLTSDGQRTTDKTNVDGTVEKYYDQQGKLTKTISGVYTKNEAGYYKYTSKTVTNHRTRDIYLYKYDRHEEIIEKIKQS
ncbi:hypothetical protein [Sulfurimonas sp. HSL3-7]|uniref:hypothetical protein n=1 Tax=Sulfonitrofixus jiaomeiensis TaxID=3131938 RepID=UPI0031F817F2